MINIGRLNKKIIILKPSGDTTNSIGEIVPEYVPFKTVNAEVMPLTGREYTESQKIRAETTYRVTIRYFPNIKSDMRISYKEKQFKIESVLNVGEKNQSLQLMCFEDDKSEGDINAS